MKIKKQEEINYWKIAPGNGGELWPEQRDAGVIAVGWNRMGNLDHYHYKNYNQFKKDFKDKFPKRNPKQLWRFYKDVKKGHKIIACAGSSILGIGTVIDGKYKFRKDFLDKPNDEWPYSQSKRVNWEITFWEPFSIENLKLPSDIKGLFENRVHKRTLCELKTKFQTGEQVFEKIKKAMDKRPSNSIEKLREWEGLLHAPQSEQELIILFSKMSQILRMKIEFVSTYFPDALIKVRKGSKWITKYAEFEFKSSEFNHFEKMKKDDRVQCDYIICWEDDSSKDDKRLFRKFKIEKVIELRKELAKII